MFFQYLLEYIQGFGKKLSKNTEKIRYSDSLVTSRSKGD